MVSKHMYCRAAVRRAATFPPALVAVRRRSRIGSTPAVGICDHRTDTVLADQIRVSNAFAAELGMTERDALFGAPLFVQLLCPGHTF